MIIYDRWGNTVFESRNETDKWNARLKGTDVPSGNFIWIAEAVTFDGSLIQRKGSVIVLR